MIHVLCFASVFLAGTSAGFLWNVRTVRDFWLWGSLGIGGAVLSWVFGVAIIGGAT